MVHVQTSLPSMSFISLPSNCEILISVNPVARADTAFYIELGGGRYFYKTSRDDLVGAFYAMLHHVSRLQAATALGLQFVARLSVGGL